MHLLCVSVQPLLTNSSHTNKFPHQMDNVFISLLYFYLCEGKCAIQIYISSLITSNAYLQLILKRMYHSQCNNGLMAYDLTKI